MKRHKLAIPVGLIRPIGLLVISVSLSLIFTNNALAFECGNVGTGDETTQDDGGFDTRLACGESAAATGTGGTAVGGSATASGLTSTALGSFATASGDHSTALGRSAAASGIWSTALGRNADASKTDSTAVGGSATASGTGSTALGLGATASGDDSTALGREATASAFASTASGRSAQASGISSTAVGYFALSSGISSTALGRLATATGSSSTALGRSAQALSPHTNATALGWRAQVGQSNAMVLGSIPGVNSGNAYVDVGIGTSMPAAPLHIFRDDGTQEFMFLESDAAGGAQDRAMMQLSNNGGIRFQFDNTLTGDAWRFQAGTGNEDNFEITKVGSGQLELLLQNDGDLFITGSLTQNSDVNAKQDIEAVDGQALLAKLDTLPVAEWTYKRDTSGARHLGPMAQDFHAAFGLGEDETKIAPGDMAGISLAAIKAQQGQIKAQQGQIKAMQAWHEQTIAEKNSELADVKDRLARLESLIEGLTKPIAGL